MKKIILVLSLLSISLFAAVKHEYASQKLLDSKVKIIDIRTPAEWHETGLLKGSIPIMFFDEERKFNMQKFLSELNKYIKPGEEFALICRTGSRTAMLADYLDQELGYKVINIRGGILYAIGNNLPIEPYPPKK
jgi:rhodanese-related sulfurtransferase